MFTVVDNFGEQYGEFETLQEAEEVKIDLIIMDSEDYADYRRRQYYINEVEV